VGLASTLVRPFNSGETAVVTSIGGAMTENEATTLPAPDLTLRGRFAPGEERRYAHVPFVVPDGVRLLHLRCRYNDRISSDPTLAGGNTLDLGLFDEHGTDGGGPGFRGWSGSELLALTVGETWATPPYRPGPLGTGTWHVLLGPYKIGPRGLDWTIDLWFNPNLPQAPTPSPPPEATGRHPLKPDGLTPPEAKPAPPPPGWVRADLHCHTRHSDGDSWPLEVLAAAAAAGLDVLGITDHNAAIPHVPPPPESGLPLLIPGVEVTTYGGHWNAWGAAVPPGAPNWFDFRDPTPSGVQAAMEMALARGAFVSVNHPKPFGPPWMFPEVVGHHAIEVWNGPWERLNATSLADWETRLRRGDRLVAVGGSDTHRLRTDPGEPLRPPRLGEPTTWIYVGEALTVEAVLAALRVGRCFLSASPAGPQVYLAEENGEIGLRVVGAPGAATLLLTERGCVAAHAVERADQRWPVASPDGCAYVRAQVVAGDGTMLALTNPIWLPAAGRPIGTP
jgi:hypothetical protein